MTNVTRYQYDEAGNQLNQIDALNRTNTFVYDSMGRRTQHSMPGTNRFEGLAYDTAGNLVYQTNFNGAIITNLYDMMNRLTNRTSVGGYAVSIGYTQTGQRATMTDASGTTTYGYDKRDRLLAKTNNWSGVPAVSLTYGYDADGNVTTILSSTSSGVNLAYSYDALSRLTNVLANGGAAAAYGFDLSGNLQTMRYGNGVTNQYQYDSLNRLTSAVWKLNASLLASFNYQLGLTGNRLNLSEVVNVTSRTNAWKYDSLYRMTNEAVTGGTTGTIGYSYDAVGNRTIRTNIVSGLGLANQSFTFNTNDWLKGDSYDYNGNTTGSGGSSYVYDPLNHLTTNGTLVNTYDGDGGRASEKLGSTTTYYLLDDRNPSGYVQVLEEYQGGSLSRVYNYGLALISQRQVPSGTVSYYGYDGHGSTRFLLNTNGTITDTYTYDAYGIIIASNIVTPNNYLYCGQQYDSALGLYYNRARYLNPNTGRFWTGDTLDGSREDPSSMHKYLYCQANPVAGIDPSGHEDLTTVMATVQIQLLVVTATTATVGGLFYGYENGAISDNTKEQLPNPSDPSLEANRNSVFIVNSKQSVEAVFQQVEKLNVDPSIATPTPSDLPVSGVGNRVQWTPAEGTLMSFGQAQFWVTVNKFTDNKAQEGNGDHFFSVVTMGGHPLEGWRFWRVFRASGGIVVETGAVDKPARIVPWLGMSAGKTAQKRLWAAQMRDALHFGGDGQGSGTFDHINGGDVPERKQEFLKLVQ